MGKLIVPQQFAVLASALIFVTGCHKQSAHDKAQADVDFLQAHHASEDQLCDAYTKLVAADLEEHDDKDWQLDGIMQRSTCLNADLSRRLRAGE